MSRKVIKVQLSEAGIDKAIKELETYRKDFEKKVELFRQKIAEYIASQAQTGYDGSVVDNIVKIDGQSTHTTVGASVNVTVEQNGDVTAVIANGEDAVWVEFGTGVYYNGSAGSSPNPHGAELGFTIGSYGKGLGRRPAWGYKEDGLVFITRGAEATMPLTRATTDALNNIISIARSVF